MPNGYHPETPEPEEVQVLRLNTADTEYAAINSDGSVTLGDKTDGGAFFKLQYDQLRLIFERARFHRSANERSV